MKEKKKKKRRIQWKMKQFRNNTEKKNETERKGVNYTY